MQTAAKSDFVSVADYLATEAACDIRHEYLGGLVYAMAGETTDHNTIILNFYSGLRQHLKDSDHQIYVSDIRVNFDLRNDEYYYYPDLVVTCDRRDTDQRFVRRPKLVIEVLSESTERVDRREKFSAYTSIASLEEYVLVAQSAREATVFRRAGGWKATKVAGAKARLTLNSLKFSLPLAALYEGV